MLSLFLFFHEQKNCFQMVVSLCQPNLTPKPLATNINGVIGRTRLEVLNQFLDGHRYSPLAISALMRFFM